MNFFGGYVLYGDKTDTCRVRAVRGAPPGGPRMTLNGDGTVTDTATGLMWQQGENDAMNWEDAIVACEGMTLAGYADWRLPDVSELQSIVDYAASGPAADTLAFPNAAIDDYWSSSTEIDNDAFIWCAFFSEGLISSSPKTGSNPLRAVRGGQTSAAGSLRITLPAQASRWTAGTVMPIAWDTQNLGGNATITLSRDGGLTFGETIAAETANDGGYAWTVTGPASVNCMLKIEPAVNPSLAAAQGLFSILESAFVEQQRIATHGARDWESFVIDGETYLVVANSYDDTTYTVDSVIFKWNGTAFETVQTLSTQGAEDWEAFTIDGTAYLAVANMRSNPSFNVDSAIFRFNPGTGLFEPFQSIATHSAWDWEFFRIDGVPYLAVANSWNGTTGDIDSVVYRWDGDDFQEFQSIATHEALDWESFTIDGDTYLAVANYFQGTSTETDSVIYKYNDLSQQFEPFQTLSTLGGYEFEHFVIDGDTYLAVANYMSDVSREIDSVIYRWNGSAFEVFQSIPTQGAKAWEFFTADGEAFLAVANYRIASTRNIDSKIYRWNGAGFETFQAIRTSGAMDLEVFAVDGIAWLAAANAYDDITRNIDSVLYSFAGIAVPDGPASPVYRSAVTSDDGKQGKDFAQGYLVDTGGVSQLEKQLDALSELRRPGSRLHLLALGVLLSEGGVSRLEPSPWHELPLSLIDSQLTERQGEAVRKAIATPDVCLIQGPPGTGKTRVISEIVRQAARRDWKVLLVAPTHVAVDNVLERIGMQEEVSPVRCVRQESRMTSLNTFRNTRMNVARTCWLANHNVARQRIWPHVRQVSHTSCPQKPHCRSAQVSVNWRPLLRTI